MSSFSYKLPKVGKNEFPSIQKPATAKITLVQPKQGEIQIIGNSDGLLYLAKHFVAMGLIQSKNDPGFHVHMDAEAGELDVDSLSVTIQNTDLD